MKHEINIMSGKLLYKIETEPIESIELSPSKYGEVEPEIPHHVQPLV